MDQSFQHKLIKLKDYQGEDEIITYLEIQDELKQHEGQYKTFKSRFPTLDAVGVLNGFESGELVIISGPTKSGKTLFGQSLTYNFWRQDIHSLWFSYELTYRQFGYAYKNTETPVILMPKKLKPYAIDWLEERIAEAVAKYGIVTVFIDHLHFLFDLSSSKNASLEIGQLTRRIKRIAVEANIVIFLICHLKKFDPHKEPDHSDFRDSALIACESDTGLMVWRKKKSPNQAVLKICYSRRTGCLEKKINIEKLDNKTSESDGLMIESNKQDDMS